MVLKRQVNRNTESFIRGGGLVSSDVQAEMDKTEWTRISLNLRVDVIEQIDALISKKMMSRTRWIQQAIEDKLQD